MRSITYTLIFFILAAISTCCRKNNNEDLGSQKVSYYLYNFCKGDQILEKHALFIEEKQLNDSTYKLQITNHNQVRKEFYSAVCYDRLIYQKIMPDGIYFSTDSLNFQLHYNFVDTIPIEIKFSVFGFFKKGYDISGIQKDTIVLNDFGQRYYIFNEFPGHYKTIFCDSLNLPLYCKDIQSEEYYILSEILKDGKRDKYISISDSIKTTWKIH